ncbi:chemotaxis protein CheA [Actinomarinicola tropica]|uniref:histidine kinase n=1 Tax=Actinomarinicola tropica TaxID=2789776 RepID=A0A5Q2RK36_9ACTN|nr:chemotaxis protein CheA [Actinomarinicola tropica]QGG94756.1 histidine kinase [Actinomarinicola tropica]
MDDDMIDEVVGEFLVESYEALDQLDQDLLALEDDASPETLAAIFRTMHTIKGTCGFLGFAHLESVAHAAENLLSPLRDGELAVTPEITTVLLSAVDAVRAMLVMIERTGGDGESEHPELVAELQRLQDPAESTPPPPPRVGDLLVEKAGVRPEDVELAISEQALGDERPIGEILVDHGVVAAEEVEAALNTQSEHKGAALSESTIRVDVRLLDDLMNLVGELVLARNQIVQLSGAADDESLTVPAQRLNHITTELQEGVMRTRMQPIGNVWNKFPRVVRDLAHSFGKQVQIEMDGADTELDKTIVEAIKDPLTHLVRNSVDHGIETPEQRRERGKSPDGRLTLRAFHEGGQVIIEIADDGAGIDVTRVGAKAVERGLITPDALDSMSQRELVNLIFLPGFSTAEVVTNVSGRGVGMDVVKTNIERIGGTLDVTTERGQGSTFRIKIPLTLAIIPALVVGCGEERFAIPQVSLLELVRIDGARLGTEIEWIHGAPVHRLRGRLLPVVDLATELQLGGVPLAERPAVNMVVLQADGRRFGLVVDEITDTQEIVVKPLGTQVSELGVFAGATTMGDGRVALILDVLGLAQRAHIVTEGADGLSDAVDELGTDVAAERDTVLVVDVGGGHRAAVALSTVARLEQLACRDVESSSQGPVVQYRGELLPLVPLAAAAGIGTPTPIARGEEGLLEVVVCSGPGGQIGLVVDRIVDIVEENISASRTGDAANGATFVAVVGGQVTDVVDVDALVGTHAHSRPYELLAPVAG